MTTKQMLVGMVFGNGYGAQAGAWRWPGVDAMNLARCEGRSHRSLSPPNEGRLKIVR
jgi:hypothetical protein